MGQSLKWKVLASVLGASLLSGCGTYVPDVLEFWAGDPNALGFKVNAIASQVQCELRQAVRDRIEDDRLLKPRRLQWLEGWGAQVTLTLQVDERSAVSPGATLKKSLPSALFGTVNTAQTFTLGLGGTASTGASRTSKVIFFFNLKDFLRGPRTNLSCLPNPVQGDLFIQSDLKLKEWLYATTLPQFTGLQGPLPAKDAITHQVKFNIVSSGNVTPVWTLVNVTANATSPFFSTSRDRTQDLLITLGPTVQGVTAPVLSPAALNSHLASEIGLAVTTGVQSLQPR